MTQLHTDNFLGISLTTSTKAEILQSISDATGKKFSYIVTPNVDHINNIASDKDIAQSYKKAKVFVCDSKVLAATGKLFGKRFTTFPGSDLTVGLLNSTDPSTKIAIIGPSISDFHKLSDKKYFNSLIHIQSPSRFNRGDPEWNEAISKTIALDWDILLVCLSFPKQEFFCEDLTERYTGTGVALCVGASVDFLTGKQKRAPKIFQILAIEWLYRLLANPRRMYKRYIYGIPKFFLVISAYAAYGKRII